jgi:hypothetical protein
LETTINNKENENLIHITQTDADPVEVHWFIARLVVS